MLEQECQDAPENCSRQEHVDRCLSMIMHFEEVQLMAGVIKEIISEQENAEESKEDN